jgi:hypothetical protein
LSEQDQEQRALQEKQAQKQQRKDTAPKEQQK